MISACIIWASSQIMKYTSLACLVAASILAAIVPAARLNGAEGIGAWDAKSAANHLDARQSSWRGLPAAARDQETVCLSCHSTLPYSLARPALRAALGERAPASHETLLLNDVLKRVRAWKDIEPWYPDQTRGIPKTTESRGTEAVINALMLASRDEATGVLSPDARQAFANLWALQMRTGDLSGAWAWLSFRLEPWEGPKSPYYGATLAAIAVGMAPEGYATSAEIQKNIALLRGYLTKQAADQHTMNKMMLLWASAKLAGLVTPDSREALLAEIFSKQQPDGGWGTANLGPWKRLDGSSLNTASDGYATGLATYALLQSGLPASHPNVQQGLRWLTTHQDKSTGGWLAVSLNKNHDPEKEASKFMNDAATAYAVLALTSAR
jgi:squalene-hopene/tetraprenyl-beta-curcumene cyclase